MEKEEAQDLVSFFDILGDLTSQSENDDATVEEGSGAFKGLVDFISNAAIIKIKYHKDDMPHLHMTAKGDWCDLYTAEDVSLKKGDFQYVSLGVSMELDDNYEAIIAPRSSTFKKWGIIQTNGIGVVDNSFNGDNDIWMMPCYATRDVEIPAGTRLCQFRVQEKQPNLKFAVVDSLGNEDRKGLGSTGD